MKGSALSLRYMQLVRKIINFPVLNDNKTFGLLKKFRSEAIMAQNNQRMVGGMRVDSPEGQNIRIIELEKKLIEDNLDKMRMADERSKAA